MWKCVILLKYHHNTEFYIDIEDYLYFDCNDKNYNKRIEHCNTKTMYCYSMILHNIVFA